MRVPAGKCHWRNSHGWHGWLLPFLAAGRHGACWLLWAERAVTVSVEAENQRMFMYWPDSLTHSVGSLSCPRRRLCHHQKSCRPSTPRAIRWIPPSNYHSRARAKKYLIFTMVRLIDGRPLIDCPRILFVAGFGGLRPSRVCGCFVFPLFGALVV